MGAGFGRFSISVAIGVALLLALAAPAFAAPATLWTGCENGEAAGQCRGPRGLAANSENGHIYVADQLNRRIDEFNALGQFIRAWGRDVVLSGPGDDTVVPEDEAEICVPADGDVCKAGLKGGAGGEFEVVLGVGVDSVGDIYVQDTGNLVGNRRVQKFSPEGAFIWAVGRDVNKTKEEEAAPQAQRDVCTAASGNVCQGGIAGTGPGEFSFPGVSGDLIEADSASNLYVGDGERIQRLDTAGAYQDECSVAGDLRGLTTGPDGSLYAIWSGDVHKLSYSSPACADLGTYPIPKLGNAAPNATAVAVDSQNSVYAFGPINSGNPTDPIFRFGPAPGKEPLEHFGGGEFDASLGMAANLCEESDPPGNLYVANFNATNAFVRAYGSDPVGCFKARTLQAQPVTETTATLNGTVNPKGEAVSECRFEYGPDKAYGSEAPCVPDGAGIGTGTEPVDVSAQLEGLPKGTVYHFRLLAKVGGNWKPALMRPSKPSDRRW